MESVYDIGEDPLVVATTVDLAMDGKHADCRRDHWHQWNLPQG